MPAFKARQYCTGSPYSPLRPAEGGEGVARLAFVGFAELQVLLKERDRPVSADGPDATAQSERPSTRSS